MTRSTHPNWTSGTVIIGIYNYYNNLLHTFKLKSFFSSTYAPSVLFTHVLGHAVIRPAIAVLQSGMVNLYNLKSSIGRQPTTV